MCLEDLRLARKSPMNSVKITAKLGGGTAIPMDMHRVGLIFSAPPTNRITLSWNTSTGLDQGVNLYPGGTPLVLDIDYPKGSTIGPIFLFSAVADQDIFYQESVLSEE